MKLAIGLAWHTHPWEELLALVRLAGELGFEAAYVDGDVSMLDRRRENDVLDGWTVTAALLACTERIGIGSMRLVHHWNAARLAQAVATAERLAPGRLRFLISAGDRAIDDRFGLPLLPAGDRADWLNETLTAVRALWRGETVSCDGRFVKLDGATVRPTPPKGRPRIEVAARSPRMLERVATHADVWDVNLPPLADRVTRASEQLERACRLRGRDPGEIARSMWIFTRVDPRLDRAAALTEYRRFNPWFDSLPDAEVAPALVIGGAAECRERLSELATELRLDRVVVDLSGLDAGATRDALQGVAGKC